MIGEVPGRRLMWGVTGRGGGRVEGGWNSCWYWWSRVLISGIGWERVEGGGVIGLVVIMDKWKRVEVEPVRTRRLI